MKRTETAIRATHPVQTSVKRDLYDRIEALRKKYKTKITEILDEGCKAIERNNK